MGLLSFMPNEKEVKKLQATIKQYETEDGWQLFLWREEEDIVGLIGVVLAEQDSNSIVIIQHITVNPSFRRQGIGGKMVNQVKEMYDNKELKATDITHSFFNKCNVKEI